MTAAAITGHRTFHGPSGRCTALTGHSAELSHRGATKVRGAMQVKGSSHGRRTDCADPLQCAGQRQVCSDCRRLRTMCRRQLWAHELTLVPPPPQLGIC